MEQEIENMRRFDMGSLRTNFPQKRRGLSRYYSGKARSFTCIADVTCVEDLKKPEHPDAKKRKKYSDRKEFHNLSPYPCRRVYSSSQFATACVGV
ncbi:Oxidative stress 3 [Quillaja saponaria]|uniref:Oxidative stress 3 n=1 Tax=Quillaja saponaria TaxID=32244 RepID=A0AAD7VK54_QUISA|nr:Oxidative stress 3 [Quillaja saponaria]KAJ7978489.1 Oxidative stress 3 [Quillaja saponaria]